MFIDPATMPRRLGVIAEWNPLSAAATAVRELFTGAHTRELSWAGQHALTTAMTRRSRSL